MHENIFNGWFKKSCIRVVQQSFLICSPRINEKLLEIVQENLILNSSGQKIQEYTQRKKKWRERERSNHQIVQNVIE
jgi:hypothetical protein